MSEETTAQSQPGQPLGLALTEGLGLVAEALKRAYYYTDLGVWRGPEVEEDERWEAAAKVAFVQERALRRLLAARVGMPNTYMDDGEAFGKEHGISIDFIREPVADIDAKLRALNVARAECSERPNVEVRRERKPAGL